MTCYLAIAERAHECEGGCSEPVGPGLVGLTDELRGQKPVPICSTCLSSLDPRLRFVLERGSRLIDDSAEGVSTSP